MATTKEFLAEILDRLSGLDGVTHRAMMGEYILYYNGKIVGGMPPSCRSCCVPCTTNFRHRNPRRKSNKE